MKKIGKWVLKWCVEIGNGIWEARKNGYYPY